MTGGAGYSEAELRLVEEWPDVLGRVAIVSRQRPTPFFRALRAKDLDLMKGWTDPQDDPFGPLVSAIDGKGDPVERSPVECIRACLQQVFRFEWGSGDFSHNAGKGETAEYILVYLCPRRGLAWNLLKIFVPLLRPELWDDQFRWRLEHMFFEHAWAAVFDFDDLEEPRASEFVSARSEPFDWPGSLNSVSDEERRAMLEYAGLPPLADPERPAIAPWNERWFNLEWLWNESAERPPADALRDFVKSLDRGGEK